MLRSVFLLITLFQLATLAAQPMSKAQKKEIKKELKSYMKSPEDFEKMKARYEKQIKDMKTEVEEANLERDRCKLLMKSEIQNCEDSINNLRSLLTAKEETVKSTKSLSGTVYGVQIGKYKFFDVTAYFGQDKYLNAFSTDAGFEYVALHFKTPKEAEAFAKDVQKMGIKDAFVTKYIDGKRVPFDIQKDKE